ncbi:MAG: hypothetical protein WCY99_05265, partial [Candidatus Neomarinimicrobiota bacterium]
MKEKKFYWKPSSFSWDMSVNQKDDQKITRTKQDTISSYAFGLSKNLGWSLDPFESLKISYRRSINSDLQDYRDKTWKIFTDLSYDSLMNGINVGNVNMINEVVNTSYNPNISVWFKPRFTYAVTYRYTKQNNLDYANVSSIRNFSASVTLSLKQIWDTYDRKFKENQKKREAERKKEEQKNEAPP